MESSTGVVLS